MVVALFRQIVKLLEVAVAIMALMLRTALVLAGTPSPGCRELWFVGGLETSTA
jgi:hypothetical protein